MDQKYGQTIMYLAAIRQQISLCIKDPTAMRTHADGLLELILAINTGH